MKLTGLVPVLRVPNLEESLTFYREVLGFECVSRIEGWACLQKDGVELMLALPNAHEPFKQVNFTGSFYFRTPDVGTWWTALKDKARILYPIEDFDYGMREFAVLDNNGYCLQFGTPLDEE